jgi:hypothetical protein
MKLNRRLIEISTNILLLTRINLIVIRTNRSLQKISYFPIKPHTLSPYFSLTSLSFYFFFLLLLFCPRYKESDWQGEISERMEREIERVNKEEEPELERERDREPERETWSSRRPDFRPILLVGDAFRRAFGSEKPIKGETREMLQNGMSKNPWTWEAGREIGDPIIGRSTPAELRCDFPVDFSMIEQRFSRWINLVISLVY